jgi:hypothetical protein
MEVYAEVQKGKVEDIILGKKTPTHYYYVSTLVEWFPEAKIIHTFRDQRAILVSTIKKVQKKKEGSLRAKVSHMPEWLLDLSITHISAKQMGCDKLSPYYIKVREKSKC